MRLRQAAHHLAPKQSAVCLAVLLVEMQGGEVVSRGAERGHLPLHCDGRERDGATQVVDNDQTEATVSSPAGQGR